MESLKLEKTTFVIQLSYYKMLKFLGIFPVDVSIKNRNQLEFNSCTESKGFNLIHGLNIVQFTCNFLFQIIQFLRYYYFPDPQIQVLYNGNLVGILFFLNGIIAFAIFSKKKVQIISFLRLWHGLEMDIYFGKF